MTRERNTSYDLKWQLISIKNVSEVLPQQNLLIGCPALARLPNSISVRCESDGLANWYSEQVQKRIIRQHTSDRQAGKGPVNTINAYITQELSSHSSHMRPGTVLHQKETVTSRRSDSRSEDIIPVPNSSQGTGW